MAWSTSDIPDLTGRTAVITGASSGLGENVAKQLALHGADLVLAVRNIAKGEAVADEILRDRPDASIDTVELDLASLDSAKRSAADLRERLGRLDILVNNAGIMATPKATTSDGFELQMGTNHLGHFAWTATLWPLLARSHARVVTVSSLAHSMVRNIDLRTLTPQGSPRRYSSWQSYGESKLANLMFALELDRRIKAAGIQVTSIAAHPGIAATNLTRTGPELFGVSLRSTAMHRIGQLTSQPAFAGAWPLLMAATDADLIGGEYIGPTHMRQTRGRPGRVGMTSVAKRAELAAALWNASEEATGLSFEL